MKKKTLRYYQKEACQSVVKAWEENEIPCVSMMTALGKALCCAALAEWAIRRGLRVLCLVPTFELVQQNHEEFIDFLSKPELVGVVCNQLNKKQLNKNVIIAMYQSFVNKRNVAGKFDVCIIDEAHQISNNENSQYRKIIKSLLAINPEMKICGWTASPYRMGQGLLTEIDSVGEPIFTTISYDTSKHPGIPRLVEEKYLARIKIANTHDVSIDLSNIKMSGNEFNQVDVGIKFDAICEKAVNDLKNGLIENEIDNALIFVSSINNAIHVIEFWNDKNIRFVSSKTHITERKEIIDWFKNGSGKRYLVNVGILTTGFNMPSLQAVVLMRATTSPGLLIQMIGRLIRPYGEMTGLVWDYGSNVERLGGIDDIKIPKNKKEISKAPRKLCLLKLDRDIEFEEKLYRRGGDCYYENIMSAKKCKKCGGEFIPGVDGKYSMRSQAEILAEKEAKKLQELEVTNVAYSLVQGKEGEWKIERYFAYETEFVMKDYLRLDTEGFPKEQSDRFLLSLFKNKKDYYKLGQKGRTSTNICKLLNSYPEFFLKPRKLYTRQNGRFTNIIRIDYEEQ